RRLLQCSALGRSFDRDELRNFEVNKFFFLVFLNVDFFPNFNLGDVDLSESRACQLYRDCIVYMWRLYNECKLVHADLSEFNTLYHNGKLYVIDVSQSVEHDHPHALEFLRKDCTNIT
ncbi:hypothetical protein L9F63_027349, partial [Diploptera punctata]